MTDENTNLESTDINSMNVATDLELPSLTDFQQEPSSGAWPDGWYPATVIEGFASRNGKEFVTGDTVSAKGDSRNLLFCSTVTGPNAATRNMFYRLNYKPGDLSPERIAKVKELRAQGTRENWGNKWPDDLKSFQSTSLTLGRLAEVERSFGFKFRRTEEGHMDLRPYVGQECDVRLRLDKESGFSEIAELAKKGERSNKKK